MKCKLLGAAALTAIVASLFGLHTQAGEGDWNQYEITCKGDTIKLVINGKHVNEGTNAELTKGKILLQSEGAEIHFRNVELKHLR